MAETVKKTVKAEKPAKPDEIAAKDAAKATLQALAKTETQKAAAVIAPSQVQVMPKAEIEAVKEPVATEAKPAASKAEIVKAAAIEEKTDAPKGDVKAETKKEADPSKEFVDGIMTEMSLKGASKKRLIKMLVEQYGMDKQRVMFKLKRALISERYAALHAEGGTAH